MSEQIQEILDIPREFVKDGMQFLNRCQKRTWFGLWREEQLRHYASHGLPERSHGGRRRCTW